MIQPHDRLRHILTMVAPFRDFAGNVYLNLPIEEGGSDISVEEVPLNSPDARAWIESVLYDMTSRLPTPRETETAERVIRGYARERPAREPRSPANPETVLPPLGQACQILAERGGTKDRLDPLLTKLTNIARRAGLLEKARNWPQGVDSLGRQLSDLTEIMAMAGVIVEPHRGEHREWIICREEDRDTYFGRPIRTASVESDGEVTVGTAE
jgi:hypothetical protein